MSNNNKIGMNEMRVNDSDEHEMKQQSLVNTG